MSDFELPLIYLSSSAWFLKAINLSEKKVTVKTVMASMILHTKVMVLLDITGFTISPVLAFTVAV